MTTRPAVPKSDDRLDNVWAEVDTAALRANAGLVGSFLQGGGRTPALMAVVKANGYGHGAATAALAFRDGGAAWFGVTSLAEASELVDAGIDSSATPVLVFSPPVNRVQCDFALDRGIHLTVCDREQATLVSSAAQSAGRAAAVHLKVNTGMGRLGLSPEAALAVGRTIVADRWLTLRGVYTHFPAAGAASLSATTGQLRRFQSFCEQLTAEGAGGFVRHCANSAAAVRLPDARMDLVRIGTLLYGQYPSAAAAPISGLVAQTLTLRARAVFVHDLAVGATVGYGSEFVVKRPTRAAVLPVGFADGVTMQPASLTRGMRGVKGCVADLVNPRALTVKFGDAAAPVIGRVAMQMLVVDVTDCPLAVRAGDVAEVPVRRLALSALIPRVALAADEASL